MKPNRDRKFTVTSGWYSLILPEGWIAEEADGNRVDIYAEVGESGVLQISAYSFPKNEIVSTRKELEEYLEEQNFKFSSEDVFEENENGKEVAYIGCVDQQEFFWRLWFIKQNGKLFFLSYNSHLDICEKQKGTIDEIVKSLAAKQ